MSEYISRDYAMKKMHAIVKHYQSPGKSELALCEMIIGAPAADVAPVIHEHYKKRYLEESEKYDLECSKCGFRIVLDYYDIQYARYCNSCGAKMDESEDKNNG